MISYDRVEILDSILGSKGKSEQLLKYWGSMEQILKNVEIIKVTPRQRQALKASISLRYIRENDSAPTNVSSPENIYQLVKYLEIEPREKLVVICLDVKNNVLGIHEVYRGSVSSSQVRISEVLRDAIIHNASAIIVAHNHPSGDPTPSPDDVGITRAIFQAGKLMDIKVLDHIVIGFEKYVSLKERGLGFA